MSTNTDQKYIYELADIGFIEIEPTSVASNIDVDPDTMERVQGRCVREVKQVNGEIKFEDALKYQKGWD